MGCTNSTGKSKALEKAETKLGAKDAVPTFETRLREEWEHGDKNKDGALSVAEVKQLLHKLNIEIPERELKVKFAAVDKDGNGELSFDEFRALFEHVESLPDVRELFTAACGGDQAMVAEELQRLVTSSSCGKVLLSIPECVRLIMMHEGCGEAEIEAALAAPVSAAAALAAAAADAPDDAADDARFLDQPLLSYRGFQRLLLDPRFNSAADRRKEHTVYQDMSLPLSHYWISSSHNTYLSGNQLSSESKPEAILRALKLGVRVVELDAWDGASPEAGPIVNHGHTVCKPTSFRACVEAVKEGAFIASPYPVIITIENHCSPPFQAQQRDILTSVLGDSLYLWPGGPNPGDWAKGPDEWASPKDLLNKVVIRDKPTQRKKSGSVSDPRASSGSVSGSRPSAGSVSGSRPSAGSVSKSGASSSNIATHAAPLAAPAAAPAAPGGGSDGGSVDAGDAAGMSSSPSMAMPAPAGEGKPNKTASFNEGKPNRTASFDEDIEGELENEDGAYEMVAGSELLKLMYIKNVKLKPTVSKETGKVTYAEPPWRSSSSIGEAKMLKLTKPGYPAMDLALYATRHLVRTYPAGTRFDSSNYLPQAAWNAGCQLVALNYQTASLPVWINQGRFVDNGGSGYVLKPDFLQPVGATMPQPWDAKPAEVQCELTVTVISGHYLPKPAGHADASEVIDPFVEVSVHGVEADEKTQKTKVIDNNGFNPRWNETFSFNITAPEVALISFVVKDKDIASEDLISQAVLPVTALVPGFKVVPLKYGNCAPQDATLFVRISFSPCPPRSSTDSA
jgi:hypothetical protein